MTTILPAAAQDAPLIQAVALAEFGTPAHPEGFEHWPYANPEAPKGGTLRLASPGSFDSLNYIPIQGESARSIFAVYESLMVESQQELSVYYPRVAESVAYAEDGSEITFFLNPAARFHDGEALTAEDVAFSLEAIQTHGQPFLKSQFDTVETVEIIDDHTVRFVFSSRTMKPLTRVAGSMPILPSHYWAEEGRDLGSSFLDPPLGSGPYRLAAVDPGRSLTYERVPDYWGADLPVNRGLWNFDRVEIDYFRDRTILFEAFKADEFDYHRSYSSREWGSGYEFPAAAEGLVVRQEFPMIQYRGMQGYYFNTRLDRFSDPRVREAMGLLYPFGFVQNTLMFGYYDRIESWFPGSGWGAEGLPTEAELALLEPFRDQLDPRVFEEPISVPGSDQEMVDRGALRRALALFEEAGYVIEDGVMVDADTGEPFTLEIVLRTQVLEPHTQPLLRNLERIGVSGSIRLVDTAQFQRRYQDREFEMISFGYTFYPPPGGEEADRFGSEAADTLGSANLIGVKDEAVDALLAAMIDTQDMEEKRVAAQALDRVLMWGFYAIPHWYGTGAWLSYWDRFGRPDQEVDMINYGLPNTLGFQPTWWWDDERSAATDAAR